MYSSEVNCQIVIALLKAHGIRKVVASPGTTNIAFVGSIQNDPWFEVYSCVDERHAAYLACGLSDESGEPVVISCTGATASRNYVSALTEAYYRKLPILALTSSQVRSRLGQLHAQMIDRTRIQNDIAKVSVWCPIVKDKDDFCYCEREVNRAILELVRHGGGPVHINLETRYSRDFSLCELPNVRKISRYTLEDVTWPDLSCARKIAIWMGAHKKFSRENADAIGNFVKANNAVVLTDMTSGYDGYGKVFSSLLCIQKLRQRPAYAHLSPDLIIHVGGVSGDYPTMSYLSGSAPVWRVDEDGEIRDTLGRLEAVFEMSIEKFVAHYNSGRNERVSEFFNAWKEADETVRSKVPELPFSNNWIAKMLVSRIPGGAPVHLGILNTLRAWNLTFEEIGINGKSNVGGFGIDGGVSSLIGASLACPSQICFGLFGDLSFFYDLNALGNRHIGSNLRIVLINNGRGGEFFQPGNNGELFGKQTDQYIAAGGHFGHRSPDLVRHYAADLGFEYIAVTSKDEFCKAIDRIVCVKADRSILVECFVDIEADIEASRMMRVLGPVQRSTLRGALKKHVPESVKKILRKIK